MQTTNIIKSGFPSSLKTYEFSFVMDLMVLGAIAGNICDQECEHTKIFPLNSDAQPDPGSDDIALFDTGCKRFKKWNEPIDKLCNAYF